MEKFDIFLRHVQDTLAWDVCMPHLSGEGYSLDVKVALDALKSQCGFQMTLLTLVSNSSSLDSIVHSLIIISCNPRKNHNDTRPTSDSGIGELIPSIGPSSAAEMNSEN